MADEFVEVVNTTITSTQLPSNNSTHTLKTAGANESFALKDLGIKTKSQVAEYSFLLNDFEALSFGAGESGVASGLDLIPKSGTLKIKGTNIPIDSESALFGVAYTDSSNKAYHINEQTFTPEFSRPKPSLKSFENDYSNTDTFDSEYTSVVTSNSTWSYAWRDGDRFRKIIAESSHTSQGQFVYADTAGGSATAINAYSVEYVPDLNKVYYIDTSSGYIKVSNTNASISFSNFVNANASSSLDRIYYSKGWLWVVKSVHDSNPTTIAYNTSTGRALTFSGSNKNYQDSSNTSSSMGFAVSYDPNSDKMIFYRTSYQTNSGFYISKHVCPKTLTEMNAYSSDTTISDNFTRSTQYYTRSSASSGPFAYNKPHYLRGSSASGDIFYLPDTSISNGQTIVYYYDFRNNTLNNTGLGVDVTSPSSYYALVQTREVSTADETEYGGSFSNVDVRATAIKTT